MCLCVYMCVRACVRVSMYGSCVCVCMCESVYVTKLVISVYEHVCAATWTWGHVSMYECAGACVCKCVSVGAVCKCIICEHV